mmetsp:Transcript_8670/g.24474  ORF Transcript_8670/g.24474 Transcript_8670/m.24474 type:complete len:209 (+) Transcript_8670:675-1301(+)
MPRHRVRGEDRARHGRALWAGPGVGGRDQLHAGQGSGGGHRRVHHRPQGGDRHPAPEGPAVPLQQLAGAARGRGQHQGLRDAVLQHGPARQAGGQHQVLPRRHEGQRVQHLRGLPRHRAHHARGRQARARHGREDAGEGRVRHRLQLPRGAQGEGPHPGAALRVPLHGGPRQGHGGLQGGGAGARVPLRPPSAGKPPTVHKRLYLGLE